MMHISPQDREATIHYNRQKSCVSLIHNFVEQMAAIFLKLRIQNQTMNLLFKKNVMNNNSKL